MSVMSTWSTIWKLVENFTMINYSTVILWLPFGCNSVWQLWSMSNNYNWMLKRKTVELEHGPCELQED